MAVQSDMVRTAALDTANQMIVDLVAATTIGPGSGDYFCNSRRLACRINGVVADVPAFLA